MLMGKKSSKRAQRSSLSVCSRDSQSPANHFESLEQVSEALAQAGLGSSNVILGIDFTISNEWTGKTSFSGRSLHHIGVTQNPYEQAMSLIGRTLSGFDDNKYITCFGFGDASTHDKDVFSFYPNEGPCRGFKEVLTQYREIVPRLKLAGPTSYAPIIEKATTILKQSGGRHHILIILADGQFVNITEIMSKDVPLSIKEMEFAVVAFVGILKYKAAFERNAPVPSPLCAAATCTSKPTLAEVAHKDPIQRAKSANTQRGQGNAGDNGSGSWFGALEGESEISRTGGWNDLVPIGNCPVPGRFVGLYKKIWLRHGHLATRDVVKTSTFILVAAVSELLESITVMATAKRRELDASLLAKWDGQIADAEALQFRVGWLRKQFNEVRKTWEAASLLIKSEATLENALTLALQSESAARIWRESLQVQLAKAELVEKEMRIKVIQHRDAIAENLAGRKQYRPFFQKTFLHDAF